MRKSMSKIFFGLCAASALVAGAAAPKPTAMIVMVDGLRADAVENLPMANLLKLGEGRWRPGYRGAISLEGRNLDDARPSSAANHSAIATGVTAKKTGIYKNGDTKKGNFAEWPSWLCRLVDAKPDVKALYAYSWSGDIGLSPHPKVADMPITSVVSNNWPLSGAYVANALEMAKVMASPDAPDAVLYFIDIGDWGGHRSGFYPYGVEYEHDILTADRIIGDMMEAIASRPSFKDEDWLVMVTSDHGGYGRRHGIWGGHSTTIPIVMAGRSIAQGRIPGTPRNYDLAPAALAHFGLDISGMKLDGRPIAPATVASPRRLDDGLAVYIPFDGNDPVNAVAGGPKPRARANAKSGAEGGLVGGCLRCGPASPADGAESGVSIDGSERLAFENGADFAFTLWVRMERRQAMQAPIVSNKDWESGSNPGLVLIGARKTDAVEKPGVCFNCGMASGEKRRLDLGTFDIDYGGWGFYAVVRRADGSLSVYQGNRDGHLYWISDDAGAIALKTGLPFWIGQDGTGRCKVSFEGAVDDFALWTRSLSRDEVRRIYEAGRRGEPLSALIRN